MAMQLSASAWWLWLTILTSILVGCYRMDTNNSVEYMYAIFTKFVAISAAATLYWFFSQTLCKKSQSLQTHKLKTSSTPPRDASFKYGLLKPTESFEWIEESHEHYIENKLLHNGAYTVLRTVEQYNLFQFNMHITRLLQSIHQQKNVEIPHDVLRRCLIVHIREGLDEVYQDELVHANEVRVMIYIDSVKLHQCITSMPTETDADNDELREKLEQCLLFHFGALPALKRPISACIRVGRQVFAEQNKSTLWAKHRHKFEKEVDSKLGLNEIIMTEIKKDEKWNGYMMEGLSSNFAVLQSDLSLLTADLSMGVLGGTVRGFVIDIMKELRLGEQDECEKVCAEYGKIPNRIIYGRPNVSDMLTWKGIAIMSTTRLFLPIDTLYIDIDDETLLKLVDGDKNHAVFQLEKSSEFECGYRKIVYGQHVSDLEDNHEKDDYLENMRVFIKHHMKSHSVYVGSVFNI